MAVYGLFDNYPVLVLVLFHILVSLSVAIVHGPGE